MRRVAVVVAALGLVSSPACTNRRTIPPTAGEPSSPPLAECLAGVAASIGTGHSASPTLLSGQFIVYTSAPDRAVAGLGSHSARLELTTQVDSLRTAAPLLGVWTWPEVPVLGWYVSSSGGQHPVSLEGDRLEIDLALLVEKEKVFEVTHTAPLELHIHMGFSDGFAGEWIHPYDYVYPVNEWGRTITAERGSFCAIRIP